MIAKEKAKEIICRFLYTEIDRPGDIETITLEFSKKCGIILCNEMINEYTHQLKRRGVIDFITAKNMCEYWINVIKEIEKYEV